MKGTEQKKIVVLKWSLIGAERTTGLKKIKDIDLGGAGRGRNLIWRNPVNLIVGWCGRFLFFVVPRQFSRRHW